MTKIGGAGGSKIPDEIATGDATGADHVEDEGSGSPTAKLTARPKSLNMHGMGGLQAQLEARLKAGAADAKARDAMEKGSFFRATGMEIDNPDAPAPKTGKHTAAGATGKAGAAHGAKAAGIGSKDYNAGIDALFQATIQELGDSQMSLKLLQQPKRAGEPFLWELKGPGWVNPLSVQLKNGKLSVIIPDTGEEAASVKLKMPANASPPSLNAFRRELEAKSAELSRMFG